MAAGLKSSVQMRTKTESSRRIAYGKKVEYYRDRIHRMSVDDLAGMVACSDDTIRNIESGRHKTNIHIHASLSIALGASFFADTARLFGYSVIPLPIEAANDITVADVINSKCQAAAVLASATNIQGDITNHQEALSVIQDIDRDVSKSLMLKGQLLQRFPGALQ